MSRDIIRRCVFRPYRKGMGPTFTLTMWDCHSPRNGGHQWKLGYRLTMLDNYTGPGCTPSFRTVLFEGEDFGCSPMHAIDSNASVHSLMTFLTLRPGDTDREYFQGYTPEQLDYCAQHAKALGEEVERRFCDENGKVIER